MQEPRLFHETLCELGEGPVWHEDRLYWFDIGARALHARGVAGDARTWRFDEQASAAGRLEGGELLVAFGTGLYRFDPARGSRDLVAPLEPEDRSTRSNDGRADRQGGFWIGTMGKDEQRADLGRLYRFHRGEVRLVREGIAIPNGLAFSPDGRRGYFTDTARQQIFTWPLDEAGWPAEEPELLLDLSGTPDAPDGTIVDAEGGLWVALYGGGRVLRVAPDGTPGAELRLPVSQPTCPAAGPEPDLIFVTTASENLSDEARAAEPLAGAVFYARTGIALIPEPFVAL